MKHGAITDAAALESKHARRGYASIHLHGIGVGPVVVYYDGHYATVALGRVRHNCCDCGGADRIEWNRRASDCRLNAAECSFAKVKRSLLRSASRDRFPSATETLPARSALRRARNWLRLRFPWDSGTHRDRSTVALSRRGPVDIRLRSRN